MPLMIERLVLLTMFLLAFSTGVWGLEDSDMAGQAFPADAAVSASAVGADSSDKPVSTADLAALSAQFQAQLDALRNEFSQSLSAQRTTIDEQRNLIAAQEEKLDQQQQALAGLNAQLSQVQEVTEDTLQTGNTQVVQRLDYLEQHINDKPDDPLAALADSTFPGSWRIPGTNAAMRIGGYVKMNIVNSFDPLLTRDRFIVGTIPPDGSVPNGAEKGASLTAQQSRVNLDLRDHTDLGVLRAFVEGDFATPDSAFRLRHAYGQFGSLLAGQTWSTLMDPASLPEELDFEGINGAVIARQPQLRFFPQIGRNLNLRLALEDPSPDVSGGIGSSGVADVVVSLDWSETSLVKQTLLRGWSLRTGLIGRQIRARPFASPDDIESTPGWGLTVSGSAPFKWFDERDSIVWQFTGGKGIGRYINDLGTIGGYDAIFSPDNKLKALPVFAGYVAAQHWWNDRWHSNANVSFVRVDSYDFQSLPEYIDTYGNPYDETWRTSVNLLFTPVRRLELGVELLWGERKNADDTKGSASQMQISARYIY